MKKKNVLKIKKKTTNTSKWLKQKLNYNQKPANAQTTHIQKKELKISAILIFPTFQWIPFQVTQRNMNMLGLNEGLLIKQVNFIKFCF